MELINFLIAHYYLSVPLVVVLVLLFLSNAKKGGKKISAQELINISNQDRAMIIDIRDSESFNSGHITSSKSIPLKDLVNSCNQIKQDNKYIIIVCEMGSSSPNAGEILKKEGFDNICILKGGINGWKMDNLPLV